MAQKNQTPSEVLNESLHRAYRHFNRTLFDNRLPKDVVILIHRHRSAHGYFGADWWKQNGEGENLHEIALHPEIFDKSLEWVASVLVHEMCHLEQRIFGKPSKNGYHNAEWANMMLAVDLRPTSASGKMTGTRVWHEIVPDGKFQQAFRALKNFVLPYAARARGKAPKPRTRKHKFVCPACELEALAKKGSHLVCGDCEVNLQPAAGA